MLHENLIFVVCSPRSGSTLLQRMLGSHSAIHTHPEPHLLTPLNYLGYYDTVDKAPYDHINAAQAMREFCAELPNGEQDYLDALRCYTSTLYERVLEPTEKLFFLDKTPEYATVLPFLTRLYPKAKYVVLTRHPLAIWHSQVHSFFGGDYAAALETNPIVPKYVRAIGDFLVEPPVPYVHVRYEDLVQAPQEQMTRVLAHIGLEFEPAVVDYGTTRHVTKSYGDPMAVEKHTRPVTDSMETWAADLNANPEALKLARQMLADLDPDHLQALGYPNDAILEALGRHSAHATKTTSLNSYRLKRQVLLRLRKNIHENKLGDAVKKVRYYCDVLLRT